MLEFTREQYLWLFALVGVFLVYFLARRYRRARVTYGFIWERVGKLRPPAWKRILRMLLTILVSLTMLGSVALYAAGLGPPREAQTPPLVVFVIRDCTPSMRARGAGGSRRELAARRAAEVLARLGERDRAVLIDFRDGSPRAGPWLKNIDRVNDPPPTDFAQPDMAALNFLLATIGLPPDMPTTPAPHELVIWIGDDPPELAAGAPPTSLVRLAPPGRWRVLADRPCLVETIGESARNDGLADARFTPARGDAAATFNLATLGDELKWTLRDADGAQIAGGGSSPITLPPDMPARATLAIEAGRDDALPEDDGLALRLIQPTLQTIVLCHPGSEEPNALLIDSLKLLLPGRTVKPLAISEGFPGPVKADLVILDRVAPRAVDTPLLLAFGAVPDAWGRCGRAIAAAAGLFEPVDSPADFAVPDPSLISAREAVPLLASEALKPLVRHVRAGTLVARGRNNETDALYVGFSPHESGFLFVPAGPLLLQRWLAAAQSRRRSLLPPCMRMDESVEIALPRAGTVTLELQGGWPDVRGATRIEVRSGPDGRLRLGPFEQPGEWAAAIDGASAGTITVYWADAHEQDLSMTPLPALELAALKREVRREDWRDLFPGVLLWIALFALVAEWLLWLAGITD